MKKIFRMIFSAAFIAAVSFVSTSCIVLVADDCEPDPVCTIDYNGDAKLCINNLATKTGKNACYISEVYVSKNGRDWGEPFWKAAEFDDPFNADDNCKFFVESGSYYICLRVVYPNMDRCYDFYDDFYTDYRYYFGANKDYNINFDGESVVRKY